MIKSVRILLICAFIALLPPEINAQQSADSLSKYTTDSSVIVVADTAQRKHSPVKASLFSMVIPGLGQAYNKKYWKIPLVYAGIGIPFYYALGEDQDFHNYKRAYKNRISGDTTDNYTRLTNDNLLDFIDIKRRNRDLLMIISSVVYILNIVDASVDAHFFYFNVDDDLSLHVNPTFNELVYDDKRPSQYMPGVRLTFYFN